MVFGSSFLLKIPSGFGTGLALVDATQALFEDGGKSLNPVEVSCPYSARSAVRKAGIAFIEAGG